MEIRRGLGRREENKNRVRFDRLIACSHDPMTMPKESSELSKSETWDRKLLIRPVLLHSAPLLQ